MTIDTDSWFPTWGIDGSLLMDRLPTFRQRVHRLSVQAHAVDKHLRFCEAAQGLDEGWSEMPLGECASVLRVEIRKLQCLGSFALIGHGRDPRGMFCTSPLFSVTEEKQDNGIVCQTTKPTPANRGLTSAIQMVGLRALLTPGGIDRADTLSHDAVRRFRAAIEVLDWYLSQDWNLSPTKAAEGPPPEKLPDVRFAKAGDSLAWIRQRHPDDQIAAPTKRGIRKWQYDFLVDSGECPAYEDSKIPPFGTWFRYTREWEKTVRTLEPSLPGPGTSSAVTRSEVADRRLQSD